jgi:hypothetical protein
MKTSLTTADVPAEIRTERLQNALVECDRYANPHVIVGMFTVTGEGNYPYGLEPEAFLRKLIFLRLDRHSLSRIFVSRSIGRADDRSIHATRRAANTMLPPCWIT